jgi:hypothetical protein
MFVCLFLAFASPLLLGQISFTPATQGGPSPFTSPILVDVNGDGWLETLGTQNDGAGNLLPLTTSGMGVADLFVTGRPNDLRVADFNGDGCPDFVAEGYSSTNTDTRALLYFNDGTGFFNEDPTFAALNLRGRGEGLVVADFNNDGYIDLFLPYYTFEPCTDPLCPNSPQSYLFLNDGKGGFREVAAIAGVALSSPDGATPEGSQAADVDNNGLIDLYAGGHLFMNQYIDASGIPHFQECDCGLPTPPVPQFVGADDRADEGFKFLDWNNDGLLDLVIQNWGGPLPPYGPPAPPGPTLYQNTGTASKPFFTPQALTTDGTGHPFFSTGAPDYAELLYQSSYGVNAYDMDNDGLEDIIVSASGNGDPFYPTRFFRNTGKGYEQVIPPDLPTLTYGVMAFGDINRDGRIDLIYSYPTAHNPYYSLNTSTTTGSFVSIEMLGANGEQNQQGRVVTIRPESATNVTYTRVVDGGTGYHAQNQYALLVGTPYVGAHDVTALYGAAGGGTVALTFTMDAGQYAQVFAPSSQFPSGHAVVFDNFPPVAPSIALSSNALNFGTQHVDTQSSPQTLTITDACNAQLLISAVATTGDFSQTNDCSSALSVKSACSVQVTFSPTTAGSASGTLSITDNALVSSQIVSLAGTGASASLGFNLAPNSTGAATIKAGQSATYNLSIGGEGLDGTASFSCTGLPTETTCTFVPATVSVSKTSVSSLVVTVATTGQNSSASRLAHSSSYSFSSLLWLSGIPGFVLLPGTLAVRDMKSRILVSSIVLGPVLVLCSCGGSSSSSPSSQTGTPAGTYTFRVTADVGSGTTSSMSLRLTVQ